MKVELVRKYLLHDWWCIMYKITVFSTTFYINAGYEFFYQNKTCDILVDSYGIIWVFTIDDKFQIGVC
jgi:hypothetical protein